MFIVCVLVLVLVLVALALVPQVTLPSCCDFQSRVHPDFVKLDVVVLQIIIQFLFQPSGGLSSWFMALLSLDCVALLPRLQLRLLLRATCHLIFVGQLDM